MIVPSVNTMSFCHPDVMRYSVWAYASDDDVFVYDEQMPNTDEIWFEFHKFSHLYWLIMESECVDNEGGKLLYNFCKIRMFLIRRMLVRTSFKDIPIQYDADGVMTDSSMGRLMTLHPRILRGILNKVDIFPDPLSDDEQKDIEKQCMKLFGKGESVQNPHRLITTYCNLSSFWEKFGLNYFDIMNMPYDLFSSLKKIMSLESSNKSASLASSGSKSNENKKVRF